MQHPFERFTARPFRSAYLFFLAATLVLGGVLGSIGQTFSAKRDPGGVSYDVVAFELAHTPQRAALILSTWGEDGIAAAKKNTRLDYLFLLSYSNLIALGVVALYSNRSSGAWVLLGRCLAWGQWMAALLDALENTALLRVLDGHAVSPWPELAFYCASVKFALVLAALFYLLAALPLAFRAHGAADRGLRV